MPTFLFSHVFRYDDLCDGEKSMSGGSLIETVRKLVNPIMMAQQFELVDVEFKREGQVHYLRIFIDKPGGITIDDCQKVSRECEIVLDVEDVMRTQYVLEVSSPGLDRPLKTREEFKRFQKRLVKIKTFRMVQGRKKFLGYLQGITEDTPDVPSFVTIISLDNGEEIQIPYELIASARLEVEF
jgi:ribosome maturation factor RimP